MQTKQMLKSSQPIVFKTIENGFKNNKKSHAYLISGSKGMPLKETALFLAQSFLCDEPSEHLACEECITCIRIKENNFTDFIFINGEEESIKKEMIDHIQDEFSKTSIENKGLKIYLIHLVEKATSSAINGLLKFLEEPSEDVVAILTTENISKVLATIISRCQLLRLKTASKSQLIDELIEDGITKEDAKILSTFYNSKEEVDAILEEGNYNNIKDLALETFQKYIEDDGRFSFFVQRNVYNQVNSKQSCTLFLDFLELLFKDNLNDKSVLFEDDKYKVKEYQKEYIEKAILDIIVSKGKIDLNVNIPLLLDGLCYELVYNKGGN